MQEYRLMKRGKRYYFYARIPADLVSRIGKLHIAVSLRTGSIKQARRRLGKLQAETEDLFTTLRLYMLSDEQIAQVMRRYKGRILAGLEHHRKYGSNMYTAALSGEVLPFITSLGDNTTPLLQFDEELTSEDIDQVIAYNQKNRRSLQKQLQLGQLNEDVRRRAYRLATENKLPDEGMDLPPVKYLTRHKDAWDDNTEYYEAPPADFRRFAREMIRAEIEVLGFEIDRLQGNDTEYDRQLRQERERPSKMMHEAIDDRLELLKSLPPASEKTERNHFKFLRRVMPNKLMREFSEQEILDLADDVIKIWPVDGMKHPDLTVAEILSRTDLGAPLANNTIRPRLNRINSLFEHAKSKGWVEVSPCPTWKIEGDQSRNEYGILEDDENYEPWSIDEILRLLTTTYFKLRRHRLKTPENFWLPVLALLTGCRQNELCQLYCDDVLQIDGRFWMLRIPKNDERRQKVKNKNSNRLVPVCQTLIDLGFLDYCVWIMEQGHERLWPGLSFYPAEANYSHNYGNRFGTHTEGHMTWDDHEERKVFHGFRKSFIATLHHDNGARQEDISFVTGHAPQDKMKMVVDYAGMAPAAALHRTIGMLDYGIDFVGLLGRWNPKDGGIAVEKREIERRGKRLRKK